MPRDQESTRATNAASSRLRRRPTITSSAAVFCPASSSTALIPPPGADLHTVTLVGRDAGRNRASAGSPESSQQARAGCLAKGCTDRYLHYACIAVACDSENERLFRSLNVCSAVPDDRTAKAVIRDEALRLFAECGVDAVTVRQIAAAAGVSPA